MGRETEIKIELTAEEYARLRAAWNDSLSERVQANYFFETPGRALGKAGAALRLRIEPGRATLTLKESGRHIGDAVDRPETECTLDDQTSRAIQEDASTVANLNHPPVERLRELVPRALLPRLYCLGSFQNLRATCRIETGASPLTVELDKTTFANGSVDYEVECEVAAEEVAEVGKLLRRELAAHGIQWKVSRLGKYARFLSRL